MNLNLVTCPYCGAESLPQNVSFFGGDGNKTQMLCLKCDKVYLMEMKVVKVLISEKADCLNGSDHLFEQVILKGDNSSYTAFKCSVCGTAKTKLKINEQK